MDNNERQPYGWGKKGERVYDEKPGFSSQRMSILACLDHQILCAPLIFEGYCNRDIVELYFEQILLPAVGPGKTIILDNASFHKGGRIKEIVAAASCHLLYLPAYSPDLNSIEHHWFSVKNSIRSKLPETNYNLWEAAEASLQKMGTS
jgi:transposase